MRCMVLDVRVQWNFSFVCICIEFKSVQLHVFAFLLCDNWISLYVCIDR